MTREMRIVIDGMSRGRLLRGRILTWAIR